MLANFLLLDDVFNVLLYEIDDRGCYNCASIIEMIRCTY